MEASPKENFLYDAVLPKVELIGSLVAILGLLLRMLFLLPGGDTLVMSGLGSLAIAYSLRAFEPFTPYDISNAANAGDALADYVANESRVTVLARYLQFFGNMLTLGGVLFKFLFWHGANFMLPVGTIMLLLLVIWQSSTGIIRRQTILIASLGVCTWAISNEVLLRLRYPDDSALVEKILYHEQHPYDRAAALATQQALAAWRKRPHQLSFY